MATQGVGGGYQLGRGRGLPPLLLDDAEAVAVAVSLRMAAGGTVSGASEAALRTLAKLDQVMPPRLRGEVRAIHEATQTLDHGQATVDGEALLRLARACPRPVRVRFDYESRDKYAELAHRRAGRAGRHRPPLVPDGLRRRPRRLADLPARPDERGGADDLAVQRARARGPGGIRPARPWPARRTASRRGSLVHAPLAEVAERTSVRSVVLTAVDDDTTLLEAGAETLYGLAFHLSFLGWEFEVQEPAELRRRWPRWAAGPCGRAGSR